MLDMGFLPTSGGSWSSSRRAARTCCSRRRLAGDRDSRGFLRDPATSRLRTDTAAEPSSARLSRRSRSKEALLAHMIRQGDLRRCSSHPDKPPPAGWRAAWTVRASTRRHPFRPVPAADPRACRVQVRRDPRLVATDVAVGVRHRGPPVVVNFELPWNPQDYIHRLAARAARVRQASDLAGMHRRDDLLRGISGAAHGDPVDCRRGVHPRRNTEPRPGRSTGHARTSRSTMPPQPVRRRVAAGEARTLTAGQWRQATPPMLGQDRPASGPRRRIAAPGRRIRA